MTNDPLTRVTTRSTRVTVPQSQPIDERQVPNNAGGFTFEVSDMARLRRFLMLGVDDGTYYVNERDLAIDNAQFLMDMIGRNGESVVAEIVNVSTAGRAPRQNPTLFALALAASIGDVRTRQLAFEVFPHVVRTGTHLFIFTRYVEQFRGWGRGLKRAVANWYLHRPLDRLTYQIVKYRQREGWTHRDVLRSAHPRPHIHDTDRRELFDWICGRGSERWGNQALPDGDQLSLLEGFLQAQKATDPRVAARLIRRYRLSWEMLPDAVINSTDVWEALLEVGVPQTALMRQLPRLTNLGMLTVGGPWTRTIAAQLNDPQRLTQGRVHPINVLIALRTYQSGHGMRGGQSWTPSRPIVDALDVAFYAAFGTVQPSGARMMLALDVSGSMTHAHIANMPLTARDASAAMALVTAKVESSYEMVGFGRRDSWGYDADIQSLDVSPRQRLDDVMRTMDRMPFGRTDCALPMLYAQRNNLNVDTFVIYTDSETWYGNVHPHMALERYRQSSGIAARLVVVGMTATDFTIADPSDHGSLDVVGFDTATPQLISDFAGGEM